MLSTLKRSTKRLLVLLTLLPTAALVLGTLYMLGMDHLEGSQSWPRSVGQKTDGDKWSLAV